MVSGRLEFADRDVTSRFRQPGDEIVAGRHIGSSKNTGYRTARTVVAAAHAALVEPFMSANRTVATDGLKNTIDNTQ